MRVIHTSQLFNQVQEGEGHEGGGETAEVGVIHTSQLFNQVQGTEHSGNGYLSPPNDVAAAVGVFLTPQLLNQVQKGEDHAGGGETPEVGVIHPFLNLFSEPPRQPEIT